MISQQNECSRYKIIGASPNQKGKGGCPPKLPPLKLKLKLSTLSCVALNQNQYWIRFSINNNELLLLLLNYLKFHDHNHWVSYFEPGKVG